MDSEILKEISSCNGCPHWYTVEGRCWPNWRFRDRESMDFECPKDVKRPQQEFAKE